MAVNEPASPTREGAASLTQAERFLRDFHDADPGATSRAFGSLRVVRAGATYASTYQSLLAAIHWPPVPITVLDLACGDGYLLSLLPSRGAASLIGIDLSQGELAAARQRLGVRATLHHAKAQALPLASSSVGLVLCHLALMLMDDVDGVITEVRRVATPGAQFCCVVGAPQPPSAVLDAFLAALAAHAPRQEYRALRLGNRHLRDAPGIEELLGGKFSGAVVEDVLIERRCTPTELWNWYAGMYDLHLLPDSSHDDVLNRFIGSVTPMCDADGRVDYRNTLRQFSAIAA